MGGQPEYWGVVRPDGTRDTGGAYWDSDRVSVGTYTVTVDSDPNDLTDLSTYSYEVEANPRAGWTATPSFQMNVMTVQLRNSSNVLGNHGFRFELERPARMQPPAGQKAKPVAHAKKGYGKGKAAPKAKANKKGY